MIMPQTAVLHIVSAYHRILRSQLQQWFRLRSIQYLGAFMLWYQIIFSHCKLVFKLIDRQWLVKQEALCYVALVLLQYLDLFLSFYSLGDTFKSQFICHGDNVTEHYITNHVLIVFVLRKEVSVNLYNVPRYLFYEIK